MKKRLIFIHGGDTFNTYEDYLIYLENYKLESLDYFKRKKWGLGLQEKLSSDFEVIAPIMPNKFNAKYIEWKIYFEKILELLDNNTDLVLVGHSLGGTFLVKYLAENILHNKISGLFIVSAPFDDKDSEYSLADFILPENLSNVSKQTLNINFYHSKDDLVVPYVDLEKFRNKLISADYFPFEDRGHFRQESFPELIRDILK